MLYKIKIMPELSEDYFAYGLSLRAGALNIRIAFIRFEPPHSDSRCSITLTSKPDSKAALRIGHRGAAGDSWQSDGFWRRAGFISGEDKYEKVQDMKILYGVLNHNLP